ncbi:unnamed protein product [Phytomonas sp. Hart1]|nr:unnamed protein product [Phytomonas sp. Hart1]|eukprot:CCW70687.1 unnamed protein product [Phytomonas sp. isolate Hart1]
MRYLLQFEAADGALLENAALEVNTMQEQFLAQKELLTAQEKKEKAAEESRNGLQNRLQLFIQRCELWQELLTGSLGRASRTLPGSKRTSATQPIHSGRTLEAARAPTAAGQQTPVSRMTSVGDPSERSRQTSGTTLPMNSISPSVESPVLGFTQQKGGQFTTYGGDLTHTGASTGSISDRGPPFEFSATVRGGEAHLWDRLHSHKLPHPHATAEEMMERRLAAKWGNPYILKRAAYERIEEINPPESAITTTSAPHITIANAPAVHAERCTNSQEKPPCGPVKSNIFTSDNSSGGFRPLLNAHQPLVGRQMNNTISNKVNNEGQRQSIVGKSSKPLGVRYPSTISLRDSNRRRSLHYRNVSIMQTGGVEATMCSRLLALLRSLFNAIPIGGSGGESMSEQNDSQTKEKPTSLTISSEILSRNPSIQELVQTNREVLIPESGRIGEIHLNNLQNEGVKVRESIRKLIKHLSEPQIPKRVSDT